MSLSTHEERALRSIKEWLTTSDPKLAALLATFTQLVAGEDMPPRERLRSSRQQAAPLPRQRRPPSRGKTGLTIGRVRGRPSFQQVALLLWLVSTIAFVTVALIFTSSGSDKGCTPTWATVCTRTTPAHVPGSAAPGTAASQAHPASG